MRTKNIEESIINRTDEPGRILLEYQPGNGTRYVLLLTRVPDGAQDVVGCRAGSWVVSLVDGALSGRCCVLAPDGYLSPSYVAEKLRMDARTQRDDLMVLTEVIGHLLGRETPSALDNEGLVERTHHE